LIANARSRVITCLSLLAALTSVASAFGDEKAICVAASEKAQQLRSAGKLVDAREQLTVCGRAECPKLVQQDCTQWTSEVLAALPSVVPAAKDRKGRDIVDVRLTVDGKVATEMLDGKAIILDPGVHSFHFEAKGAAPVDEQVVAKPGEKNRIVTVTLATPDDTGPGASSGHSTGPGTSPEPTSSGPPVAAIVVGSVGLAVGAAALFIDLGANSDARGLRDTCAPKCQQSDVDDVQKKYTLAGVTAGIGGALVVTGVILLILHYNKGSSSQTGLTPTTTFHF
jgi:hypothetical protein